ncbi:MAG: anthranilate synthase component I family protein [Eubacterium sp.]|nr:anthranilate synthase component I family protein [Eubacterium sp.]
MILTPIEKLRSYVNDFSIVPVASEILSDMVTPIEVMRRLKTISDRVFIFESVVNQAYTGRYTFLGYDPVLKLKLKDGKLTVSDTEKGTEEAFNIGADGDFDNPGDYIRQLMKNYSSPKLADLPGFTGGLVGYFSYDYIKYSEPVLNLHAEDSDGFSDMELMLFDKCIAFDNIRQKLIIIVNIKTDKLDEEYAAAVDELEKIEEIIISGEKKEIPKGRLLSDFKGLFSKEEYCDMVEKGKHYIFEGDIFQVVLSNRLEADFSGSLFDTYRMLRTSNPSPYMFYFDIDGAELAGASPETLVKLDGKDLYTYPLAGTRPRGKTPEEDRQLEAELMKDEKELSEHNMLVDLGRNDLGKISKFGTVDVVDYMSVHRYSHVMHIGSTVKGTIDDSKYDAADAIAAVLPAGTLSGAPKIRACEIINELEGDKRGVYGGAVGYIDFTGNLDTCIAIRLAFKKNNKVFVRSGAGIVADSVPETEYQECLNKARAVINALERSSK